MTVPLPPLPELTTPLRERVPHPGAVALPTGPPGVRWRPAVAEDAAAITELLAAMSTRDHPAWSETLDEVEEALAQRWVELERDTVVAEDAAGALLAHGTVVETPEPESIVRIFLHGGVHPDHRGRGLGRAMVDWQLARGRERLSSSEHRMPGWLLSYAADRSPEHGALLQAAGFAAARYFTTLEARLDAERPDRPLPEGVRTVPFSAELSERVRLAKNAAFADHWGSQPVVAEAWESMVGLPSFRADLSRVALLGEEVVGFATVEVNEEDWSRQGFSSSYVGLVGTVREHRGRGLAGALLAEVMDVSRRRGLERCVLDVDTGNPTGALGVYQRLGFAATDRDVAYSIEY
jgi:mycothiol synthase